MHPDRSVLVSSSESNTRPIQLISIRFGVTVTVTVITITLQLLYGADVQMSRHHQSDWRVV
jgi:hypothetical protein